MVWYPIFKVSSLDFENDLKLLKEFMSSMEKKTHFENGYKFSQGAQFAMGWWFYEIYVKIGFIKKVVEIEHELNPKVKTEVDIMEMLQKFLKKNDTKCKVTLHTKKSLFTKYWTWLLK